MLLLLHIARTKLELDPTNSFAISLISRSSQLHHLHCGTSSIVQRVYHKTIKVYLAGIRLKHIERGLHDPTNNQLLQLLCTGIKRSLGAGSRTRLPITVNLLRTLKTQLRSDESYSLLEKGYYDLLLHWLFMAFLEPVNLHHQTCSGQTSTSLLEL